MSAIVEDAIAEELATLERVMDPPSPPYGYGSDLRCDSDMREDAAEVDGFSRLALAEALVRRLDCPRGALPGDADYGIDLRSYCNRGTTAAEIRALAGQINGELRKDDRVDRVLVTVTPSPDGSRLGVQLEVTPIDPNVGGFALTLAVTSAAVVLEEIRGRS